MVKLCTTEKELLAKWDGKYITWSLPAYPKDTIHSKVVGAVFGATRLFLLVEDCFTIRVMGGPECIQESWILYTTSN